MGNGRPNLRVITPLPARATAGDGALRRLPPPLVSLNGERLPRAATSHTVRISCDRDKVGDVVHEINISISTYTVVFTGLSSSGKEWEFRVVNRVDPVRFRATVKVRRTTDEVVSISGNGFSMHMKRADAQSVWLTVI